VTGGLGERGNSGPTDGPGDSEHKNTHKGYDYGNLLSRKNHVWDDWSFTGAIGLHAKLSANVISIFVFVK